MKISDVEGGCAAVFEKKKKGNGKLLSVDVCLCCFLRKWHKKGEEKGKIQQDQGIFSTSIDVKWKCLVYSNLKPYLSPSFTSASSLSHVKWPQGRKARRRKKKIIWSTHKLWWFGKRKWKTTMYDKFVGNMLEYRLKEYFDAHLTCLALHTQSFLDTEYAERKRKWHKTIQAGVKKGVKCQSICPKYKKSLFLPTLWSEMKQKCQMVEVWRLAVGLVM